MYSSILKAMIEVEVYRELLDDDLAWARSVDPFGPFNRSIFINAIARLGGLFIRWGNYLQRVDQPLSRSVSDL